MTADIRHTHRRRPGLLAATLAAAVLVVGAQPALAAHAGAVDQVQLSWELGRSCFNDLEPARVAQQITPTTNALARVDAVIFRGGSGGGETLTMNVRESAIDGPILGSASFTLPTGGSHLVSEFHFTPSVPLTPSVPVFLEVRLQAQFASWAASDSNPYAGGSGWVQCVPSSTSQMPDTDFVFVTYAPSGDADGDGLPDATDPDTIGDLIGGLPDTAMADGHRTAFLARLEAIEANVAAGNDAAAISQLTSLRMRVDGCGFEADGNDWIVECVPQVIVRGMIDDMIAALGG